MSHGIFIPWLILHSVKLFNFSDLLGDVSRGVILPVGEFLQCFHHPLVRFFAFVSPYTPISDLGPSSFCQPSILSFLCLPEMSRYQLEGYVSFFCLIVIPEQAKG